uniref:Uncharacterized protein n=1 Tax=Knipowitschia caucasica TaxID=637954 RepID=A0AAV2LV22_KNICA
METEPLLGGLNGESASWFGRRGRGLSYSVAGESCSFSGSAANKAHIPTDETAKAWPIWKNLQTEITPLQDCEVERLVGYNCSQALLPREVVSGKEDEPYAQRTDL